MAMQYAARLNRVMGLIGRTVVRDGYGARRVVGHWMLATSGAILGIIAVGGLTRLTESGLSMVDWQLVHFRPPKGEEEWAEYFERYKKTPEYRLNNEGMEIEDYKRIYWWEHFHRVYGRFLGLAVIVPSLWFCIVPGWAGGRTKGIMAACSALVVSQGILGWYMVKSGLDEESVKKQQAARVSPYRLSAHLASAVTLYSILFYNGLSILQGPTSITALCRRLRTGSYAISGLVATTMLSGAFVAGLDAGIIYNSFPKMGDRWIPSDIWDGRKGLANATENPTTAQFNHRVLSLGTILSITGFHLWTRTLGTALPRKIQMATTALLAASWGQGLLGIATLLCSVPIPLASAHQIGAIATLTASLYLNNLLRPI